MPLKFQSIAEQVAGAIRTEMENRTWGRLLPGERQLAEQFHVSRKTVRKALVELRAAGVLQTERGRGSQPSPRRGTRREPSPRIALLLPEPLEG